MRRITMQIIPYCISHHSSGNITIRQLQIPNISKNFRQPSLFFYYADEFFLTIISHKINPHAPSARIEQKREKNKKNKKSNINGCGIRKNPLEVFTSKIQCLSPTFLLMMP